MGAGSGGADAVRMINRAARQARAYRADRRARRQSIGLQRGEEAGEIHTCVVCDGAFDVNFMLRDHDVWTCESCDYAAEADLTLERARHGAFWPAFAASLATCSLIGIEVAAFAPGPGIFWLAWCAVVVTASGLVATWMEGLRRAGVVHPGLLLIEASMAALAAVYVVRGLVNLV